MTDVQQKPTQHSEAIFFQLKIFKKERDGRRVPLPQGPILGPHPQPRGGRGSAVTPGPLSGREPISNWSQ